MENNQFVTQEQFKALQVSVEALSQAFYKNNFSNNITFNKDVVCNTRFKPPSYSAAPSVAEVNDLIAVNGELFICTVAGTVASPATFTLVGTQS